MSLKLVTCYRSVVAVENVDEMFAAELEGLLEQGVVDGALEYGRERDVLELELLANAYLIEKAVADVSVVAATFGAAIVDVACKHQQVQHEQSVDPVTVQ